MKIISTITALSILSLLFSQSASAYNQMASSSPDTSGEQLFLQESQQRREQIDQSRQGMIQQDRQMIRQGSDPNENYYPEEVQRFQNQTDRNNPQHNQENLLRGNQESVTQQLYPNIPK